MTYTEIKERNRKIVQAFDEHYKEMRAKYGTASFSGIYHALAKEFNLSEMQVRRVVKGY